MAAAVYDTATGAILRVVVCPDTAIAAQAGAGQAVVDVGPDVGDTTHRVVNGAVVPL